MNEDKQKCWNVYLDGKHIDTIFYITPVDEEEVLKSLIDHDGYDQNITVE